MATVKALSIAVPEYDEQRPAESMSIAVIDRRPRNGLVHWLEGSPNLEIVSIGGAADLLDSPRSLGGPQLIVLDIGAASVRDPGVRSEMRLLRRHMGGIPLVLLSDRDDVDDIVAAIEYGARGYIPTSLEPSEAVAAIQCVTAGGTFTPVSALLKAVRDDRRRPSRLDLGGGTRIESLTPREKEVLVHLCQGKSNRDIASDLEIRVSTVKVFVRRIMLKLRASSRLEAVLLAQRSL